MPARSSDSPLGRQLLIALLTIGLFAHSGFASETPKMVVIVNHDNPVLELPLSEVRHIFQGDRKRWKDGSMIEVILPRPGSPAMHSVLRNVFKMKSVAELGRYYLAAIFRQKLLEAPRTASINDTIRIVSRSKSAFAVVPHTSAIDKDGIKVIEVAGL